MIYDIKITELLVKHIFVKADSADEALDFVTRSYDQDLEGFTLTLDDFLDSEISLFETLDEVSDAYLISTESVYSPTDL